MGKSKMIAKSCPKCDMQVAVATKSCKCGHTFFSARTRASLVSNTVNAEGSNPGGEERRRTGRVRRARPHFYDSQDYQRQRRKPPKRRSVSQGSYDEDDPKKDNFKDNGRDTTTSARGRKRGSLKPRINANDGRQQRPPAEPVIDPICLIRCSTFLHEINRKMASVMWSPDQ